MAIKWFSGAESGDLSEFASSSGTIAAATDQKTNGGYSLKVTSPEASNFVTSKTGLGLSTIFVRFNVFTNVVASSASLIYSPVDLLTAASGTIAYLRFIATSGGALTLGLVNNVAVAVIGSEVAITPGVWHSIELKGVISATVGILELKIDGVVTATGSSLNTGTNNVDSVTFGSRTTNAAARASGSLWDDDMIISDSAYVGPGYSIARQGVTGTPTYNAWTKNGAATAALCWSNTPFATGTNCSNTTLNNAQTMLVGSFASAGNAQEGTGLISTVDTINAGKTAMIAKTSVAGNMSIRRRVAGADTDTVVALTTSDAYYDDGIWTPTVTNLTAGTTEIGAKDTVGVTTDTVEDMWLMVDYTALATMPLPARRGPTQRKPRPRVRPKRLVQGRVTHHIPSAPFAERPYPKARPQKKRIPHVKAKRPVRSPIISRIPPAPFPNRTFLRPRPQKKRIPKVVAKKRVRSPILNRIPQAPFPNRVVLRPRPQAKRVPHVKPKRQVKNPIVSRIPARPFPEKPRLRPRPQAKRIPRVQSKRPMLARLMPPLPLPAFPIARLRPQTKRTQRPFIKRAVKNVLLHVPQTTTPVTPILPLPVRSRRGQAKRISHTKKHKARFAPLRSPLAPPPPPPPNPRLPGVTAPIGGIVAISGAKTAELRGLKSGPTPDLSGSTGAPIATDKATKTS